MKSLQRLIILHKDLMKTDRLFHLFIFFSAKGNVYAFWVTITDSGFNTDLVRTLVLMVVNYIKVK